MAKALTLPKYNTLLNEITAIYTQSQQKAKKALNKILTQAYWEIGKRIVTVEQENKFRAQYGESLIKNLSKDLSQLHGKGFSVTNLYHMREFYVTHPILQPAGVFDWTKHCILLSIEDTQLRKLYEKKVAKEKWSKRKLIAELKADERVYQEEEAKDKPQKKLTLRDVRGLIGVYKIVVLQGMQIKDEKPSLDLGFNIYEYGIKGLSRFVHGDIVELSEEGPLRKATLRSKNDLYIYKAMSEKVVDGDTVWVNVIFGNKLYARRKLRLRGINAPEIGTRAGEIAKSFLKHTLDSVEFVVIKTYGTGKFGRYVADIYYLPGETDPNIVARDGIFLNQEMLDQGLVGLYMGNG